MELTRENLLKAIKRRPLIINTCSGCGYGCHYSFRNGQLGYDNGCYCTAHSFEGWTPREEESLDFYLHLEHGWVEKLQKFIDSNL